jgi:hypothetical protein
MALPVVYDIRLTGILDFFPIVRYSKKLENTKSRKLDLFPSSDEVGDI